jgi:hypothetical protein
MPKKTYLLPLALLVITALALQFPDQSQAWLQTHEITPERTYGFLYGIMHGFIAPFAVIGQLFDKDIILYTAQNTGFGYNIGFIFGIFMITGSCGKSGMHCGTKKSKKGKWCW